jgi:hypothetical protein
VQFDEYVFDKDVFAMGVTPTIPEPIPAPKLFGGRPSMKPLVLPENDEALVMGMLEVLDEVW